MSEEGTKPKVEIDWVKTMAGALAAVSSAVLLSTLGAAGTIIGAALGSVIATVGSAVYSQGLAESRERLAQAHAGARRKVGVAQAEVLRAERHQGDDAVVDAHLAHAQERLDAAKQDLESADDEPPPPGWRDRLRALPWRRISLLAAGLFAVAVVALTVFEMIAGEPVSSITGGTDGDTGTTLTHITPVDDSPKQDPADLPSEQPTPTETPSTTPSATEASPDGEPSSSPTETASPSLAPTPTEPLPTPTPSPSE